LNLSIPQSGCLTDEDYAAFNRDGRLLLTLSGNHRLDKGAVRVWNAATGEPVTTALIQNLPVNHAAFSPDGEHIVTGAGNRYLGRFGQDEGTLTTWSLPAGQPIVHFSTPFPVCYVRYSHDGELLLSAHGARDADRGYARIWDAQTGKPMTPEMYHDGAVQSACFSPDQRHVATASNDNTARIWDASSGEPITPPLEHQARVTSVVFSPDGTLLATSSDDNTARVWDVVTGEPVTPVLCHHGAVNQVAFSPNGHYIVTASADGAARIWHLPSDHRLLADVDSLQLVLSGRQLDGSGKLSEFETTSLPAAWESLQARQGDTFRVNKRQQTLWRDETLSGLLVRGSELAANEDWDGAERALSYAIRSAPNLPKCHTARGHLFSKMKEWEKAIADYSRAIELEPDEAVYRDNRAIAYCQAGEWANAADDFSESIRIAPNREIVHYWHTLACLGAADQKAYRDACARMMHQFAGNETASAGHWLAWSCVLAPDAVSSLPEAVKAAGRAVSEELDSSRHLNTLGAILYRAGSYEESVEWMNEIVEHDSEEHYSPAYTWFFLAMAHHQLGHEEEGRTWLKKAIDRAEEETQDNANIAWNRRLTLDLLRTEAESLLASPDVDTEPSDEKGPLPSTDMTLSLSARYHWVLHYRRAMRFATEGNWTEAEKAFWQATKLRPDKADLLIRRAADLLIGAAKVNVRLEQWDQALEEFDKVIKLRPDVAAHATIYAQMLVLANRTKEYQEACATMLHQFGQSEDPDVLCTAAQTCLLSPNGAGDPTVPLELAKRAVAMQRESGWMHYVLGMAHFRVGQYEEAANQFHDSLGLYSGWSVLHLNWLGLAMVHHELGETDKARQWYEMAVDRMTTDPAACRRRFEDWLEGQIRRREAEQLLGIRQAGQEAPQPAAREPKPTEPEVETADPEEPDNAP
jgi:WD40 repeat protein/Tfp pilus assembly protein PilF